MKVITMLNEKGGVGKTTLATTLACGLAMTGAKVVLADSDMQANATTALGLAMQPGFYNLVVRPEETEIRDVLRRVGNEVIGGTPQGALWVIPGNSENMHLASSVSDADVLLSAIAPLDDVVDYLIFDTSPSQTMFHIAVYVATDAILYPTLLEAWSVKGVSQAWARRVAADKFRTSSGLEPIQVLGVQPVRTQSTNAQSAMLDTLTQRYGDVVWPSIPQRTAWSEAAILGVSVFAHAPQSAAAEDARTFAERVVEVVGYGV
ncbi:MAG: ParA family protein [Phototrophicaceae bacterium]